MSDATVTLGPRADSGCISVIAIREWCGSSRAAPVDAAPARWLRGCAGRAATSPLCSPRLPRLRRA